VVEQILLQRYGLKEEDVARSTGTYMSALKDVLADSAYALERLMLREIEAKTGLQAYTLEEAVIKLRASYPETAQG